jgi:hypothetical protein
VPGLIEFLEFDTERMRAAADDPALGREPNLAEELVRAGCRSAARHEGRRPARPSTRRRRRSRSAICPRDDLRAVDPALTPKIMQALNRARPSPARSLIGRAFRRRGRERARAPSRPS